MEQWASWLEGVVDQVLKQHEGTDEFPKAARQFLLKWSFYRFVHQDRLIAKLLPPLHKRTQPTILLFALTKGQRSKRQLSKDQILEFHRPHRGGASLETYISKLKRLLTQVLQTLMKF